MNVGTGAAAGTVLETEGEKPENLGEGEYNYSETVVKEQGSVTITTTDVQFTESLDTENTNMQHTVSTTTPTDDNDLVYPDANPKDGGVGPGFDGVAPEMYQPGYKGEVVAPEGSKDDEYAYTYVGSGNTSMLVPSVVFTRPMTDEERLAKWGDKNYLKASSINTPKFLKTAIISPTRLATF